MPEHDAVSNVHTVTIAPSAGSDSAVVIFIDGEPDGVRIHLNDAALHVGMPYAPADD